MMDDRFEVVVHLDGLTSADGMPVATRRVSVNPWRLSQPARARTIRYSIAALNIYSA